MKRAILYYRVSTKDQDDTSQLRLLKEYAQKNGYQIVDEVSEGKAWSGSDSERPAWMALINRAEDKRDFQFLLAFDIDRLGRHKELGEDINDLMEAGVHIICTNDGMDTRNENSDLVLMVKAWQARMYAQDVAKHTRKSLLDLAKRQMATGKPPFGYRIKYVGGSEIVKDGRKRVIGGTKTFEKDPEHAPYAREMFMRRRKGQSIGDIVDWLNNTGVLSPRGKKWRYSTVVACLENPLYSGVFLFNRSKWKTNSRKQRRKFGIGRRSRTENDASKWVRHEMPELAIVDRTTWDRVQERQHAARTTWYASLTAGPPPKRGPGAPIRQLFQLKCGKCGGSFTVADAHKLACSTRVATRGAGCDMDARADVARTNAALLQLVRDEVLSGKYDQIFRDEVRAEAKRRGHDPKAAEADLRRQRERAQERVSELIEELSKPFPESVKSEMRQKVAAAAEERDRLDVEISKLTMPHAAVPLIPAGQRDLERLITDLATPELLHPENVHRARGLLASLVDPFMATKDEATGGVRFTAAIRDRRFTPEGFTVAKKPVPRRPRAGKGKAHATVAGSMGLDPMIFGSGGRI